MEIFKDIEGYEGLYQISDHGRVKSLKYGKERILKPCMTCNGYLTVRLCKNRKVIRCYVHRLVAAAFMPNPDNLPQINHKDEDKTNNNVDNLEWCSAAYNCNYGSRNKQISKTVYQYSLNGKLIAEYPSTKEVERQFGYGQGNISACCRSKQKTAYGYIWRY